MKPRWDLLPKSVSVVVEVMTWGETKHSGDEWRRIEGWRIKHFNSAARHLWSWWSGQRNDPESGLPHLAHTVARLLMLLELDVGETNPLEERNDD